MDGAFPPSPDSLFFAFIIAQCVVGPACRLLQVAAASYRTKVGESVWRNSDFKPEGRNTRGSRWEGVQVCAAWSLQVSSSSSRFLE